MKNNSTLLKLLICTNVFLLIAVLAAVVLILNSSTPQKADEPQAEIEQTITPTSEPVLKKIKKPTLKKFLKTAVSPVGSTMYVYGGGWNEADTGAGKYAVSIGVAEEWRDFYEEQDSGYDSSLHRYKINKGLDCSGYIGWAVYNTLETENGKDGYVFFAEEFADKLSGLGFGEKTEKNNISEYKAGDIMSSQSDSHAWICLGQCSDGSVVFVHSSPPGVRICGTACPDGKRDSEAVSLATQYMSSEFPDWYGKYPDCFKGLSYLTNYSQFRWYTGENGVIDDPDGYSQMSASEILNDIFNE